VATVITTFRNYATYSLLSADGSTTWQAAKRGFCMIDITPYNTNVGGIKPWYYRACGPAIGSLPGAPRGPRKSGISVNYGDTYVKWLGGQYFVLDGADGQAVIPPGDYVIRIEVNPPIRQPGPTHVAS